jgi:hypothetical protein
VSTATTEPRSGLRCPRCGANLAPDQDWCLECGAAATTRILRPPSWKLPAAIAAGVIAAVVVATVLVVNALSGDAHRAAATPTRSPAAGAAAVKPTPAPAATAPAAATTPTTAATSTTATTPSAPTSGRTIASWPRSRSAWTVVLATTSSRLAAEQRARDLIAAGVKAGILDASKFTIDASGAPFVVFTGQFPSQEGAVSAESRLGGRAPAAVFVAQVSPR